MINKVDERRKWKNANNEEGRKKYNRPRTEMKSQRMPRKSLWYQLARKEIDQQIVDGWQC
jgi:hypothetical protein